MADPAAVRIRLDVHCGYCKGLIGTWWNKIEEKYPFYCPHCEDDLRADKWPWKLTASIEAAEADDE